MAARKKPSEKHQKALIGAHVTTEEHRQLFELAEVRRMTVSSLVRSLIQKEIERT